MDVLDEFDFRQVTFFKISRTERGETKGAETLSTGVFVWSDAIRSRSLSEKVSGDATLYVRADNNFVTAMNGNVVSHGVTVNGRTFRIQDQYESYDHDLHRVSGYKLSLIKQDIAS